MPDRWGRVGYEDFMGMANAFGRINSIKRENELYKQGQNDRKKAVALESDANYNASLYEPGAVAIDESSPYTSEAEAIEAAMRGTPTAKAMGREIAAKDMAARDSIKNSVDDRKAKELASGFLKQWEQGGFRFPERGDSDPLVFNTALSHASKAYTQGQKGWSELMQVRRQAHAENYQVFQNYQNAILKAYDSADMDSVVRLVEDLSVESPMPYKYSFNQDTGKFDEFYRHSGSDAWEKNGEASMQEVLATIKNTGHEQYALMEFNMKEATRQWNEDAWLPVGIGNGKTQTFKKDGKTYYITPQKLPNRPNKVNYHVVDEKNQMQDFDSMKDLAAAGFRYEDLKRQKALKDIDYTDQQIETSKAAQGSHERANQNKGLDQTKKRLDTYNKQLDAFLKPFNTGGGISFEQGPDGSLTLNESGKNAFDEAQKFLYAHQKDWKGLTGNDRLKFESAVRADQLYRNMLNGFPEKSSRQVAIEPDTPAEQPEQPPVPGAIKAADGNWYVKQGSGWAIVKYDELIPSH